MTADPSVVMEVIEKEKNKHRNAVRGAVAAIVARNQSHSLGFYVQNIKSR